MKHVLLALVVCFSCIVFADVTFYVSVTSGLDTNDGSSSGSPFQSLRAAANASTDPTLNPDNEPVVIKISGGVYNGTNVGVQYNVSTTIEYYEEDDAPTTVSFLCDTSSDTYFDVSNSFNLNGEDNGDIAFLLAGVCKSGITFINTNTSAEYFIIVEYTAVASYTQAIYAAGALEVTIHNSIFNGSDTAFAIYAQGTGADNVKTKFEIVQTVFDDAGKVAASMFYQGTVTDTTFVGGAGNGAFAFQNGNWSVSGLNVTDATTAGFGGGGALSLIEGIIALSDSTFTDCRAEQGGAIYFENVDASLKNVQFTGNNATNTGGAYSHYGSYQTFSSFEDVTFSNNYAQSYGGAVELYGPFLGLKVEGLDFNNNIAGTNGSCMDCCGQNSIDPLLTACGVFTVNVTGSIGDTGNSGGVNDTCTLLYTDDFDTAVSVDNSSAYTSLGDSTNLTWLWIILALLAVAVIIAIAVGAGFFVYRKRKMSAYAAVD